jgi:DNA-binding NarL/FixJ family response regulator
MGQPIRILIADEDPQQCATFQSIFEFSQDIVVVDETIEAEEVVVQVRAHRPDVLVLNPRLLKRKSRAILKELQQQAPTTRILLLAKDWSECLYHASPLPGVAGYLLRSAPRQEVCMAIRIIYHGGKVMPFALVRPELNALSGLTSPRWFTKFGHRLAQLRFWVPLRERLPGRSIAVH